VGLLGTSGSGKRSSIRYRRYVTIEGGAPASDEMGGSRAPYNAGFIGTFWSGSFKSNPARFSSESKPALSTAFE